MLRYKKGINLSLLGLCVLVFVAVHPVHAEQRYDEHNDPIAHGALLFEGVIEGFPDTIADVDEVTIYESLYIIDKDCIFRNRSGSLIALTSFKEGMRVGFYTIKNNIITKMWHIPDSAEEDDDSAKEISPDAGQSEQNSGDEDPIRLEEGVWKN